jgi:hypothetical protein
MKHFLASAIVLFLFTGLAPGQSSRAKSGAPPATEPPMTEEKGTYLGVLFGPLSEVLYDQFPQVPRNRCVLVTHVLPDSPAAQADLRRNDVLLQYGDEKIRDCEHFARLIQADKPNNKVKLQILRDGKESTVEATLGLGPILKIAQHARNTAHEAPDPKAVAKPNGPAPVSVTAVPLAGDKMRVTIEYYQEGTGRLRTVTCEGGNSDIDAEITKLPERERNLARVALQRIRDLNTSQKAPDKSTESAGKRQ